MRAPWESGRILGAWQTQGWHKGRVSQRALAALSVRKESFKGFAWSWRPLDTKRLQTESRSGGNVMGDRRDTCVGLCLRVTIVFLLLRPPNFAQIQASATQTDLMYPQQSFCYMKLDMCNVSKSWDLCVVCCKGHHRCFHDLC